MSNTHPQSQFLNVKKNGKIKAFGYKLKLFWKELFMTKAEKEAFKKKKQEVLWEPKISPEDYSDLYDAFANCIISDTNSATFYSDIPETGVDISKLNKHPNIKNK